MMSQVESNKVEHMEGGGGGETGRCQSKGAEWQIQDE